MTGIDPAAYEGDIVSRLRHWRGLHLAHGGELFEAAADEIERLRTVMLRVVDEDCTVAIQNGTFYADDEPLFAVPYTPPTQPTPGEGSTQGQGT